MGAQPGIRWLVGLALALTAAAPAAADPRLRTPAATLAAALECDGIAGATRSPVLLVAGTGATPEIQYSWNYQPALTALGVPWCAVELPEHTLADQQLDAEYLVYAIRAMHRRTGRRVAVVGHSQGGMLVRWPLRFWPALRPLVGDVIGLAASNHGTEAVRVSGACARACPAAAWQQLPGSALLTALNVPVETFRGVDYTQVFTAYDTLATPAGPAGTSPLRGAANVEVQDVCPASVAEHVALGATDPVAFALVLDALDHPGPANPGRVDRGVCDDGVLPGVRLDRAGVAIGAVPYLVAAATPIDLVGTQKLRAEPALRSYVFRPQVRAGARRVRVLAARPLTALRVGRRTFRAAVPRYRWSVRVRSRGRRVRVRTTDADGRVVARRIRVR